MPDIAPETKRAYKLYIATPFYEVKAYAPQYMCLTASFGILDAARIDHTYRQLCGDSYVDRAKNAIVHDFLNSEYTHLLMLDSDETWTPEGFARLLKASLLGCEIVAGLYPCKNNWEFYGGMARYSDDGYVMGKEVGDTRLVEMDVAPGGFIIYRRDAFERARPVLDTYIDPENGDEILEAFRCNIEIEGFTRKTPQQLAKMTKPELLAYIAMTAQGGRTGRRIGEDVYFQQRYKEMGGMIWCEPNIDMGHFGVKEWKGNYQNYLLANKAKAEVEQSVGTTEEETASLLTDLDASLERVKRINRSLRGEA